MEELTLKALAKINLGLDVVRRREDGYHEVRMVMQTIHLYDRLKLARTKKPGIRIRTNLSFLPVNENNLVYKAGKMILDEFQIPEGADVLLEKRIPVAAGLAGGSSDAAAVLVGVNRMFGCGLSQEDLMARAVRLGADVPYCIMRGTVLAEGIGEILTPLSPLPRCCILLAKPPVSVSTKLVYEKLDSIEIPEHPDIDGIIAGLRDGDLTRIASHMGNVLEQVTMEEYPVIGQIEAAMKESGALNALMSGSGPTVFGIFDDRNRARSAAQRIKELQLAKQVYVTNVHNARRKQ